MKMLISFFTVVLSLSSTASTGETKTFVYDGSQNSIELILQGEKTHTEYRYEDRRSTCYSTTVVGYRTVCTGGYRPGPGRPGPAPRHCYQEPIYRRVSYPCTQTVRIPYEVKDYDVDARVIIDVTKLAEDVSSVETFKLSLMGDDLKLTVQGSKKFFIMLKKKDIRASMNGSVKSLDGLYAIELAEAAPVLAALDMKGLSYERGVLNFAIGEVSSTENVGFSLNVMRRPILGSNTVLFDRELTASEVEVNGSQTNVDLGQIGVNLSGGRFLLTPKVFFKATGTLLNASQFGDLEASRSLLLKL
jgi:hypothetical protein